MILDQNLTLLDGVDVSGAAGTALEGDVLDISANGVNPARGEALYLVINVTTAFASAGAATVQFKLSSDAAAAIQTDGTATDHIITPAFAYTDLVAGYQLVYPLPQALDYERYVGLLVVTGTATTTAGTIDAAITAYAVQDQHYYPDAVN